MKKNKGDNVLRYYLQDALTGVSKGLGTSDAVAGDTGVIESVGSEVYKFVISDETKDRDGDIIKLAGWNLNNFNKSGIAVYGHATSYGGVMDPDYVLGSAKAYVEDGKLMGEMTFQPDNEFAQKIKSKVDQGIFKAVSVGFTAASGSWGVKSAGEDEDVFYWRAQELTEFSIVPIGANPSALRKAYSADRSEYKKQCGGNVEVKTIHLDVAKARLDLFKFQTN